jgi:hypothetical protein
MSIPSHAPGCTTKTYPMKCKVCRSEVFHFACSCGSSILFDSLDPFELHTLHPSNVSESPAKPKQLQCILLSYPQSKPLREAVLSAVRKWRRNGVLAKEPERISSLKYMIWLTTAQGSAVLEPLSDLFLAGIVVEMIIS